MDSRSKKSQQRRTQGFFVGIFAILLLAIPIVLVFSSTVQSDSVSADRAQPRRDTPEYFNDLNEIKEKSASFYLGYARYISLKSNRLDRARQLIIVPAVGNTRDAETENFYRAANYGGFLIEKKNIDQSSPQATSAFFEFVKNSNKKIYPIVTVDQEGGSVSQIPWDIYAANSDIGNSENAPEVACENARQRAETLKDLGITLNLAPVVDIAYDPTDYIFGRSFRVDPRETAEITAEYIRCHQFDKEGNSITMATAKHFPGHGGTAADSHRKITQIFQTPNEWENTSALPFKSAIESNVAAVMVGHLVYPGFDDKEATQSKKLIHDVLKTELGFKGLIISDDFTMIERVSRLGKEEFVKNYFDAGGEIIIYSGTNPQTEELAQAIAKYQEESPQNISSTVEKFIATKLKWKYDKILATQDKG